MEEIYCQSCGMPMANTAELCGTEKNGEKNSDYCKFCYESGSFTFHGSMEEMIEVCVPYMVNENQGMTPETARSMMKDFLPKLKRWHKS